MYPANSRFEETGGSLALRAAGSFLFLDGPAGERGQCLNEIGSRWWRMEPEGTCRIGVRTVVLPAAPLGQRRS
ncbi:hypothetical protein SDJN03_22404, partial [Cucurbita argyrosperma subsp. sororia]